MRLWVVEWGLWNGVVERRLWVPVYGGEKYCYIWPGLYLHSYYLRASLAGGILSPDNIELG
jgi:hypothetical protein